MSTGLHEILTEKHREKRREGIIAALRLNSRLRTIYFGFISTEHLLTFLEIKEVVHGPNVWRAHVENL